MSSSSTDTDSGKQSSIRAQAYQYLAQREHTVVELTVKLLRKGYNREQIEQVLEVLKQDGVISHTRFMEDYIESRHGKGYGPVRIRQELLSKGIDEDEVDSGIRAATVDWLTGAQQCYWRKYKDDAIKDRADYFKRKRYLFQRGYPEEIIREVIGQYD